MTGGISCQSPETSSSSSLPPFSAHCLHRSLGNEGSWWLKHSNTGGLVQWFITTWWVYRISEPSTVPQGLGGTWWIGTVQDIYPWEPFETLKRFDYSWYLKNILRFPKIMSIYNHKFPCLEGQIIFRFHIHSSAKKLPLWASTCLGWIQTPKKLGSVACDTPKTNWLASW